MSFNGRTAVSKTADGSSILSTPAKCFIIVHMCYNCGCGIPEDDMGKGHLKDGGGGLIDEDFKHLAEHWGMTPEQAKRNTYELLKKQFEKK